MFAFKKFKILSMLVFLNLMIASGHSTGSSNTGLDEDHSLDGRINRAPSTLLNLPLTVPGER